MIMVSEEKWFSCVDGVALVERVFGAGTEVRVLSLRDSVVIKGRF